MGGDVFTGDLRPEARDAARVMNEYGRTHQPFLFFFDFEMKRPLVLRPEECRARGIRYSFGSNTNLEHPGIAPDGQARIAVSGQAPERAEYARAFNRIQRHLSRGDIYLVNLTHRVPLTEASSLEVIFAATEARYKLLFEDQFVVFSPETFVTIDRGVISTFPMKGTRLATDGDSRAALLNDPKEMAEHATVVDLLRNDISMIAEDVKVERYKYVDQISTPRGTLLQTSSMISGKLPAGYESSLGDILCTLLPAGSVSGAPKREALRIIRDVEGIDRGYYTGVCGIFDGQKVDSAVMIRFIEVADGLHYFRSGGGITTNSSLESEYFEMLAKVVLPGAPAPSKKVISNSDGDMHAF